MAAKTERTLIWSWALYDWANSAFATTVMAGFFPLFFKQYWAPDLSALESTRVLALSNSISSLLLALTSPVFGAIADEGAWRKELLGLFTLIGALASMALTFTGQGAWLQAAWIFSIGAFGFTAALTFYDSLLVQIVKPRDFDRVSGFGYALGYLGGGLLFALNVGMYLKYGADGVRWSFFSVGVWWLLFALPTFFFIPELKTKRKKSILKTSREGFRTLFEHIRHLKKERAMLYFLAGYFFYIDGVNTIVKMAVDYGLSIGLEPTDLIKALLLVQFIGFPAAIAAGYLGEKTGPLKGIWVCLVTYLGVTVFAYFLKTSFQFYLVAAVIGLVQGGIQSLSRSLFARLVPAERSAEYFGFFNMAGKFSSILGPLLVTLVGTWAGDARSGILVLTAFFILGGAFLTRSQNFRSRRA